MKRFKNRNDIPEKYKWDLTKIYEDIASWNNDYSNVNKKLSTIESYKGRICSNDVTLLEFLKLNDEIERNIYRLYYYAHLNFDSETTNIKYQELKGKMDDLLVDYNIKTSFINSEMLNTDYNVIKKYIDNNSELETYKHNLEDIYRYQNHHLSEEQRKVLSSLSNVLSSPEEIFESLTDSDLKFGNIKDENNEDVEFTESNWAVYSKSKNRRVRKDAFNMLYNTYANYKNTIANTFSKNVDYNVNMAKLLNFNSSLEKSLYNDAVDKKVYNNLIDTIHKNMDVIYKYFDLKKEVLNVDEFHLYDVYADLIDSSNKEYTFEQAKDIVLNALSILGDDYIENLKRAFNERWIDVYNNDGKRGGAYSSGFYDTNPYVLLNFEGRFEDVSTLAHELGHSMHTLYSCKNNTYNNSSYQIFVAEVASTVNELLLRMYLLNNTKDPKEKLSIINSLLELFKSTIYRQVMFAEFERNMHQDKENGIVLTNEYLSNKYYELNKLYFGDNVNVDENIKYEWMRIPHFYYDFYVYKYAIGLSSACYIVNNILSGKENAVENYKKFLASGGSDYPTNELLIAGVDVTSNEVIQSAVNMFDYYIDEFKKTYEENLNKEESDIKWQKTTMKR